MLPLNGVCRTGGNAFGCCLHSGRFQRLHCDPHFPSHSEARWWEILFDMHGHTRRFCNNTIPRILAPSGMELIQCWCCWCCCCLKMQLRRHYPLSSDVPTTHAGGHSRFYGSKEGASSLVLFIQPPVLTSHGLQARDYTRKKSRILIFAIIRANRPSPRQM